MRARKAYARGFAPSGEFPWIIFCMGICAAIVLPVAQRWGGWFWVAGVICIIAAGWAAMETYQRTHSWDYGTSQDTDRLISRAADELRQKNRQLQNVLGDVCRSVEFETASGTVTWVLEDGRRMSAKALPLGALVPSTYRWYWAWSMRLDETSNARFATAEIAARVRALVEPLGKKHGIAALSVPEFDFREGEGVNGTLVARAANLELASAVGALCVMKAGAAGLINIPARTADGADCEVLLMVEEPQAE